MPSRDKFKRKFRIAHCKYDDHLMWGLGFIIDWPDDHGIRDKYLVIHLGKHTIMIGLISKYEEENVE